MRHEPRASKLSRQKSKVFEEFFQLLFVLDVRRDFTTHVIPVLIQSRVS
jgi:hypothetical protein